MRHELGYILGQMGNPGACRTLATILMDESEDVLVRHEVLLTVELPPLVSFLTIAIP